MLHIVFVSSNYPSSSQPSRGTFVQQIVRAIARRGVKCSVISPVSIFDIRHGRPDSKISFDYSIRDNHIKVLRPRYISFSTRKFLFWNTAHLTEMSYLWTVNRTLSYLDASPGVLYGHYLYPSGATAVRIANMLGIPSIVAVAESGFWSVEPLGFQKAIRDFSNVSSIISVSSIIKRELVNRLMVPEEKICVIPNGVDLSLFYPRNRTEMRNKFGFPTDKIIISFIGRFYERKGPHRLLKAVSGMDNIGLIFIGKGEILIEDENVLFKGVLKHSDVPEMLSASDIFVLPTQSEGSCNAILEALACGLPVVTSRGEFNDDIVDDEISIRVDPLNLNEIRDAIVKLCDNIELRNKMSTKALERIKQFDINLRAIKILELIKESGEKYYKSHKENLHN